MKSWRVLLVDDSAAMRMFIRRVIDLSGFAVAAFEEAGDGRAALTQLETFAADIIICDVNMPVMTGEEFLVALSRLPEDQRPPVLVVSTDSTSARVQRMLALGARGYLRKPCSPEAMRDVLEQIAHSINPVLAASGD